MARSKVPLFGNWDSGEDVPYTTYFDNASKAKGDRLNPNDSSAHQERISETVRRPSESPLRRNVVESPYREYDAVKSVKSRGQEALRSRHMTTLRTEVGSMNKHPRSPLHHQTLGRVSHDSPRHQHQGTNTGNSTKRTMRRSTGSDRSIENSPLHPHQHPRTEAKSAGVSSPSWERRGSPQGGSHGSAPLTPGRSRLRSVTRGNETSDPSTSVPKFGDWDESNPASSENYTDIFTRVREERQSGDESFPGASTDISHSNNQNRSGYGSFKGCGCFPWRMSR